MKKNTAQKYADMIERKAYELSSDPCAVHPSEVWIERVNSEWSVMVRLWGITIGYVHVRPLKSAISDWSLVFKEIFG